MPNFLCALGHRIGHDAVDTDGREDHGQKGEAADGHGARVQWEKRQAHVFAESLGFVNGQSGIEVADFAADAGDCCVSIDVCAHHQRRGGGINLLNGIVNDQRRNFAETLILAIFREADHFK